MIKIGIHGATGKMGKILESIVNKFNCSITSRYSPSLKSSSLDLLCSNSDVIIDFSSINGIEELLNKSIQYKNKLVIGTTGLSKEQEEKIIQTSKKLPIIWSSNMSIGINLLMFLLKSLKDNTKLLNNFDVNIIDIHHSDKKDSPSGTAIMLSKIINELILKKINFSSLRCGNISGEHHIFFSGEDEQLILSHKSTSKIPYAYGAMLAATWIVDKTVGLYSMIDVFNLK